MNIELSVGMYDRAFAPGFWSNSEGKVCQTTICETFWHWASSLLKTGKIAKFVELEEYLGTVGIPVMV